METLFDDFFKEVDTFIDYGNRANVRISDDGIKYNEPTAKQWERWQELIEDIVQHKQAIKTLVERGIEKNLSEINIKLYTFRQLSRRMDYYEYSWSAYYGDINHTLDKITLAYKKIDRKYKLGWHDSKYERSS